MLGRVLLVVWMSSTIVTSAIIDWSTCMNKYNALCHMSCWGSRQDCYLHNWHNVCPCVVKCHQNHCMGGVMAGVCQNCASHLTRGDPSAMKSHCLSLKACLDSCPKPIQCMASADIQIPNIYYY